MTGRAASVAAAVGTLIMVLGACTGDAADSEPDRGESRSTGTVVVGILDPLPENLLPVKNPDEIDDDLLAGVLPGAFRVLPDLSVVRDEGLLSEEPTVEVNDDGQQVVEYKLDPRATWSDRRPISADDFEFTWRIQRSTEPAAGGCPGVLPGPGYSRVESVESADGGATVMVTFSSAYSDWRRLFDRLLPAHLMDKSDPTTLCADLTAGWPLAQGLPDDISGGPWQLTADRIDIASQSITLTPNPEYWGAAPGLDGVTFRSIATEAPATIASMLADGGISVVTGRPSADLAAALRAIDPAPVTTLQGRASFDELVLNSRNVHLADVQVRRAVALALDRAEIAESVARTTGVAGADLTGLDNRLLLAAQKGFRNTSPEEFDSADAAGARSALEASGYVLGADGVYAHPERGRLSLAVSVADDLLQLEAIRPMVERGSQAGIEVIVRAEPNFGETLGGGMFDAALLTVRSAPYVLDAAVRYVSPAAGGVENHAFVADPEVDALFAELSVSTDAASDAERANEIDALLWENLATIPLYQRPVLLSVASGLAGVEFNPLAGIAWNSFNWTQD